MGIGKSPRAGAASPLRRLAVGLALPAGLLVALAAARWLVAEVPATAFFWILGALLLAPVAWALVSSLWPAAADRRCPRCGADALERADPSAALGIRCRACGHRDEAASAWLLAEEEGPLEEIVLRARRAARRRPGRPGRPARSGQLGQLGQLGRPGPDAGAPVPARRAGDGRTVDDRAGLD